MTSPQLEDDFLDQLRVDAPPAIALLIAPGLLMYLSLYAFAKRWMAVSRGLVVPTLALFWMSADLAPVRCAALRALLNFVVAVASMKLLDIHALSLTSSFPTYSSSIPPRPSIMALILITELRYESFIPNPIRLSPIATLPFPSSPKARRVFYSESMQLLVHIGIFAVLQGMPQYDAVKALGILFTIWIIWSSIQICLRYKNSPPLFGPIYLADGLASFWTETWHNAFASPCLSLAYTPTLYILTHLPSFIRPPRSASRSAALVASFGLMAVFHMYALSPLLSNEGMKRIGVFFVANGMVTIIEVAFWGKKRHWIRAACAWIVELSLASWTVKAVDVADGVLEADWKGLCKPKTKRW